MSFSAQGTPLASEETLGSTVESTPFVSATIIPKKSFSMMFACTHECFCASVWVYMCIFHIHVQAREQHQMVSFGRYLPCVLKLGFSLGFGTHTLEWLRSKTKGSAFLCLHSTKNINTCHCTDFFFGNWVSNASLHYVTVRMVLPGPAPLSWFSNNFLSKDLIFSL